jgi:hypothetical protein
MKLAKFGNALSPKGYIRHDPNVLCCTGLELDYDGERVPYRDAIKILTEAHVCCIIYTTKSYTPETPSWRVFCPTSRDITADERYTLCCKLNGILGGILAGESWTLSQCYWSGCGKLYFQAKYIEGQPVDLMDLSKSSRLVARDASGVSQGQWDRRQT